MYKRKKMVFILVFTFFLLNFPANSVYAETKDYIIHGDNIIWTSTFYYGCGDKSYGYYDNYQSKIRAVFNKNNASYDRFDQFYDDADAYYTLEEYNETEKKYIQKNDFFITGKCVAGRLESIIDYSDLSKDTIYRLILYLENKNNYYSSALVVEFIINGNTVYYGRNISGYTLENYEAGLHLFDELNNKSTIYLDNYRNSIDYYNSTKTRQFALDLIKNCNTDMEKALTIHQWLVKNIEYGPSSGVGCPDEMLDVKKGLCENISRLSCAMYNGVGIPCVVIISNKMNHAWNMVYIDGKWFAFDNTNGVVNDYPSNFFKWEDAYVDEEFYNTNANLLIQCPNSVDVLYLDINDKKTMTASSNLCGCQDYIWEVKDPSVLDLTDEGYGVAKITALRKGTTTITCKKGVFSSTIKVIVDEEMPKVTVSYRTHVQSFGWQGYVTNGTVSGTSGLAKRLEGIEINVSGNDNLGIQYTTHCQSYGWLPWSANGEMNGTEGEAKRLEAIKIQLTGADKDKYDVYYRVHAQSYGWLGWAKNGEPAGTAGYAKRLEAIQIVIVEKGKSFNLDIGNISYEITQAYIAAGGTSSYVANEDATNIVYRTHVQTYGWQGWKYNGQMSGTSGQAKRLEGINIRLTNKQYSGSIVYTTHVQTYGWQGNINNPSTWKKEGQMAGTSGQAKRLEAICIKLTGEMEQYYDVYYRVHAQTYGWLGWAKNGAPAGTAGLAKRLEGIQIVLVPKGGSAPASNYGGVSANWQEAYIVK